MSRFRDVVEPAKYGRHRADLPMDLIMRLVGQGYSCRQIVKELAKIGCVVSKTTVNRRIAECGKGTG